jgi:hypothetical protein
VLVEDYVEVGQLVFTMQVPLAVFVTVYVNLRNGGAIVERDVKYAILFLSTHHPQV